MGRVIAAPQERFAQGRRKGPQTVIPRRALTELPLPKRVGAGEAAENDGGFRRGRMRTGLRLTFHGGMPETMAGRFLAALTVLLMILAVAVGSMAVRRLMGRDQRFLVPGADAIETVGNLHLTREEILGVLGDDVGRNVFQLSLPAQRVALEQLPWVERATVMRLLPDRLRAVITERTPVAFARQKGKIGLVDGHGVLLDLRQPVPGGSYSFPVVTGVLAADMPAVRAARMRRFGAFVGALDATGEHISAKLSEIDLSDPEDVRALIPDSGSEVLVHFGDADYLSRYRAYESHLPEWRQAYPKLASVDMRYERQAVLEMAPGTAVPLNSAADAAKEIPLASSRGSMPKTAIAAKNAAAVEVHAGRGPGVIGGRPAAKSKSTVRRSMR